MKVFQANEYIWFFPITLIFSLFIWLFVCMANRVEKAEKDRFKQENQVYEKAVRKSHRWFKMAVLWLIVDYLCVILPFEASAIVLCIEVFNEADRSAIVIYSILSLAMIIVAYAFHPRVHCHGYRRAYINIDHAINHYLNSDKDTKNKQLCDDLHQSELYINTSFEIGEACPFKKMMICKKRNIVNAD